MSKFCFLILSSVFLLACNNSSIPEVDLKVATANILIGNQDPDLEQALLDLDCDIYLLHEAVEDFNFDTQSFINNGYTVYNHTGSNISSFNGILLSRIGGTFNSVDLNYDLMSYMEVTIFAPFYELKINYKNRHIRIIGSHIPPSISMPEELKQIREDAFKDLKVIIVDSKEAGEELIIAGDFNTFPNDKLLDNILIDAIDDSVIYNRDLYGRTWSPFNFIMPISRIDYIFTSTSLDIEYQTIFDIPGSDHKGLIVGVNL